MHSEQQVPVQTRELADLKDPETLFVPGGPCVSPLVKDRFSYEKAKEVATIIECTWNEDAMVDSFGLKDIYIEEVSKRFKVYKRLKGHERF